MTPPLQGIEDVGEGVIQRLYLGLLRTSIKPHGKRKPSIGHRNQQGTSLHSISTRCGADAPCCSRITYPDQPLAITGENIGLPLKFPEAHLRAKNREINKNSQPNQGPQGGDCTGKSVVKAQLAVSLLLQHKVDPFR